MRRQVIFLGLRNALLAAFAFLLAAPLLAENPPARQDSQGGAFAQKALSRMRVPGTQDLQLIVELSDPSVLDRLGSNQAGRLPGQSGLQQRLYRPIDFGSAKAISYRNEIGRAQKELASKIADLPGAEVLGSTDIIMNALIVRVPAVHYRAIRRLQGVKKIYFSRPHRLLLDKAALIHKSQGLWSASGGQSEAGKGIKIGILDSGIDITNPMFQDSGLSVPPGYPKYDTWVNRAHTNAKVIVARSYVSFLYNRQWIRSAVDERGHGTFVAGCAAGQPVSAPRAAISGMAPGAFLGNYKIFGTPGINDYTTTAAILAAVNDAVADGMDVINLSFGSLTYVPPSEDAEAVALENAMKAGVIVTTSAGNDGPRTYTINNPGAATNAITVGSATNSRDFLPVLRTTSPQLSAIGYLPSSDGPTITSDQPYTRIVDVESLDGNGLGCDALPSGSLEGVIVMIKRGSCTFAAKVSHAEQAGAMAVVVYNNVPTGLVSMSGLGSTTIPAVMISGIDGEALKRYINENPDTAQAAIGSSDKLEAVPTTARVVSSFSSKGPGTDFSIKPDLVAVGEVIYSAAQRTGTSGSLYDASGFTVSQGTSFSAAMAAGAAAGLRKIFPSLGVEAIKSLLVNTASGNLTVDGSRVPNILDAGSGLLDMEKASSSRAVFYPSSLNFGVQSYRNRISLAAEFTIENISDAPEQFALEVEPIIAGPIITLSPSKTDWLAPGSQATISVSLEITAPASGGFQGFITARSTSTPFVYRIPYWAGLYVPDPNRVLRVSKDASGNGCYANISDALADAQPGNIIEIQDSSSYPVYPEGLIISTNREGLPLHGITIRAAPNQSPTIDGTGFNGGESPSNILIVGLQNVLLQGLNIKDGYTGIELYQPSTATPLSVTIDNCTISNSTADRDSVGIWVTGGGSVEIIRSKVKVSFGTGIVAGAYADGTQITILQSTIQANGNDALDAYGSHLNVEQSVFSENYGTALYLDNCTGKVDGNLFSFGKTYAEGGLLNYGDAITVADGKVIISNNLFDSNDGSAIALAFEMQTGLGPDVQIVRNTMRHNGYYSIYSVTVPRLVVDSNLLEDNAGGIYLYANTSALLLNNIIVRSTHTGFGNGVEVAGGSSARIVNNTICRNAVNGVVLRSGSVTIANSIVTENVAGNLVGVSSSSVQSSLIGVNAGFVAPDSGDYSLGAGSPAIDAGSNAVSDLPFLDFNGRLRVAGRSTSSNEGIVDVGAIESESAYPLLFPLVVNGSTMGINGSFTTGMAVSNPYDAEVQAKISAYDDSGKPLNQEANRVLISLNPQAQLAALAYELFDLEPEAPKFGSALMSANSELVGFFLFCDPAFKYFSTGANAVSQVGKEIIFPRFGSHSVGATVYVLHNPGANTASITATLYGADGKSIGMQQTAAIAPRGQVTLRFDSSTGVPGYVRVLSNHPVAGLELIGDTNFLSALGGLTPGLDNTVTFAHYAVGGNYSTQIGIINPGPASLNLTLTAYDNDGYPITRKYSVSLPGGGMLRKAVSEMFDIPDRGEYIHTGYIVAHGDQPGIVGFTGFSYSNSSHYADAAVPADATPRRRLIFSHVAQGIRAGSGMPYQTGIALLNPFGVPVQYTMKVFDASGVLIAETNNLLGPHQKSAKILSHPLEGAAFFKQPIELGNGHIEVLSDCGLLGYELFYTEDLSQLASVPAQVMH